MVLGVLGTVTVLGVIVGAVALVMRGGRGVDWAPRSLVRVYLYIASLAGIVVLVVGLSGVLSAGFAAAFGDGFVYGDSSAIPAVAACPPTPEANVKCAPPAPQDFQQQRLHENARRRGDDLIRGITFTVFGALFWGAHWMARRGLLGAEEASGLRRGYLMLGTVVFGLTTVVLLPTGIYQALSYLILPAENGVYRQGVGDSLGGGLVTLPVWLIYLWLVVRDVRATPASVPTTA
ncbi:MAG TPA: DUF5671 domain-containing protein [Candidatus Limnocylindria bacterium]